MNYRKNFTDRLQYVGILGPVILLVTLLSVLLHGSFKGWFLIFSACVSLPLIWKWHQKGLYLSFAVLGAGYGLMFPFFDGGAFWFLAASVSVALGIFTTHMGFEEIKDILTDLQVESQSRLDNLIELDEQLKKVKAEWELSQQDVQDEMARKDRQLEKLTINTEKLNHTCELVQVEMESLQKKNLGFLQDIERENSKIAKLEVELHKTKSKNEKLTSQLSESSSERELGQLGEIEQLESQLEQLHGQIYDLQIELEKKVESENANSEKASQFRETIDKLENTLRDKVQLIHQLQSQNNDKDDQLELTQKELGRLKETAQSQQHEILEQKSQVLKRDQSLSDLNQKIRDTQEDIATLKADKQKLNQQIQALEKSKEELDHSQEYLKSASDQKIKMKVVEIEALNQQLKQKNTQINRLLERNNEAGQSVAMYEERVLELEKSVEESHRGDQKRLQQLNEARFAQFQLNLDKTRLKKELADEQLKKSSNLATPKPPKHWLLQLGSILKQSSFRKVDLKNLPKDLSQEIVTLNQTKALYKQLREQFEDKNKVLDELREKLFRYESQLEKTKKEQELHQAEENKLENEMQKSIFLKEEEIKTIEEEISSLNGIINALLLELDHKPT